MGDFNEAVGIDSSGKAWVGGYDPSFEEGGISQFNSQNSSWNNVSNVDFEEIGHPFDTGVTRVSEIAKDANGGLWMGTGRGLLYMNPNFGTSSLRRFDQFNSGVPGGWTTNVEVAPDGTIWSTCYGSAWGPAGVSRYNPTTESWTTFEGISGQNIAVQPKSGGGYYVWAMDVDELRSARFDSTTGSWTRFDSLTNAPYLVLGKGSVDANGNTWMYRLTTDDVFNPVIDVLRPNGTWMNMTLPPGITSSNFGCIRAYGNNKALYADGACGVWHYDGAQWTNLGSWNPEGVWTDDLNIDGENGVWAVGPGGAARWTPSTNSWQRYRITNTAQYDGFNNDLSLSRNSAEVIACANASPGVGGLVKWDGSKWTPFNNLNYGIGFNWPFNTDNASKVYIRPSNGQILAVPMFGTLNAFNGTTWSDMGLSSTPNDILEDTRGRLWVVAGDGLYMHNGLIWVQISDEGGTQLKLDPLQKGTVWVMNFDSVRRTNGVRTWRRTISDFPELDPQSDQFKGMVINNDGQLWVSANTINLPDNGGLFKINPASGNYTFWSPTNWQFPGTYLMPLTATPDGRIWMQYDSDFLVAQRGLVSIAPNGQLTHFPAPPEGEPQWGGLPHAAIFDLEVRTKAQGYELWMSCGSRGIAVLSVN